MHIEVENIGGTNANIKGGKFDVRWRVGNERRDQSMHAERIEEFSLGAGDGRGLNVLITAKQKFDSKMYIFRLALEEGRPDKYSLQAVGVIHYVDDAGAGKKTGFSRTLDIDSMLFRASGNSEDEYQD